MTSRTVHARVHERVQTRDARILTTDTIISPSMRITTGIRINAEPNPPAAPGSFGVCWTGMAGDGSGRVPEQIDLDTIVADIEGGLALLTPAEQSAIRAKLTKFSGRQSAPVNPAGVGTNDWAREAARTVAANVAATGAVQKTYSDFWDKQNKKMTAVAE